MDNWVHTYKIDLMSDKGNTIDCGTLMVHGDSKAHTFKMELIGDGFTKADLKSSSAYGYFQSSKDKNNVINVPGTIIGNVVQLTLPGNCYSKSGQAYMIVRISNGTQVVTIAYLYMYIKSFDYTGIVDPTNSIVDPSQFTAGFNRLEADLARLESIAPMGYAYNSLIMVQDAKPSSEDNKIWVKSTLGPEMQIPTKATFQSLRDSVNTKIGNVSSDLDKFKDAISLVKNCVSTYVSGKYVTSSGSAASAQYAYVRATVRGGHTYSVYNYDSDTFSYIKDENDVTIGKAGDYRISGEGRVGVFKMPANAKFFYICGMQTLNRAGNVVVIETSELLNETYVISNYPYDTVKSVSIKGLRIGDQTLDEYVGDAITSIRDSVDSMVDTIDDNVNEIKDGIILVKNCVTTFVDGKYPTASSVGNNDAFAYVVADVRPGKLYSVKGYDSDTFSFIKDRNRVAIGSIADYKVATSGSRKCVFRMPEGARYLFIGGQYTHTNHGEVVVIEVADPNDILDDTYTVENYPYNTVVKTTIRNLTVENQSIADYISDKIEATDVKYNNIIDILPNLISNEYTNFGEATVVGNRATIKGVNGGIRSKTFFASPSANVVCTVKCNHNVPVCQLHVAYKKSDGTTKYDKVAVLKSGESYTFNLDCANYVVYKEATEFNLLVNATTSLNGNNNDFIELHIYKAEDRQGYREYSYYDSDFGNMMKNVFDGINEAKSREETKNDNILINPSGNKYSLGVDNSGNLIAIPHVPNKTLFVGNSLLLGMNTGSAISYGMCATGPQKDYAYLVSEAIKAKNPSASFDKCHAAAFENATSDTVAQAFWNSTPPNKGTGTTVSSLFKNDLDLIVIQLGDNVSTTEKIETFTKNLSWLISKIRVASPRARLMYVDGWFNDTKVHDIITDACNKWNVIRVNIHDLHTKDNEGHEGQPYINGSGVEGTADAKWLTHPGDEGFRLIAERIIAALDM